MQNLTDDSDCQVIRRHGSQSTSTGLDEDPINTADGRSGTSSPVEITIAIDFESIVKKKRN
jgi:hypothetical protein